MLRCRSCFKLVLFRKLNKNGFCSSCEKTYNENLINYVAGYKDSIYERGTNYTFNLAGVNLDNSDSGINRQKIIKYSKVGEKLKIVADSDSVNSPEGYKVFRFNGQQLGYLEPGKYSENINKHLEDNMFLDVSIQSISRDKGKYGLNVNLTTYS